MTTPENNPERILVIRLGALGDLVLCFQAFHEIRKAHPGAEIALLTMPAFADFARAMPWFNHVLIDERAPGWRLDKWAKLIDQIDAYAPSRVYDLQGKFRQSILFWLMAGPLGPEWSGAARFCKYPRLWPPKPGMHFTDFVAEQLRRANIPPQYEADLAWLDASLGAFSLPNRFVLMIPGCAPGREYKRWPPENYAVLAQSLHKKGYTSIAVGTAQDAEAIKSIRALSPDVLDFGGRTSLQQLAALARRSAYVIGNDTGPTHLAAAIGAPTLGLLSPQVNAAWSAPRGKHAHFLQGPSLAYISVDEVLLALAPHLDKNP